VLYCKQEFIDSKKRQLVLLLCRSWRKFSKVSTSIEFEMPIFIILVTFACLIFLPRYFRVQKVRSQIKAGYKDGLSQEAAVILVARDATRSLGRTMKSSEITRFRRIASRSLIKVDGRFPPKENLSDVDDVFRYLNQGTNPFLVQNGEKIVLVIPAVGLREPRSIRTTTGGYAGPSFRITKGVYFRVGGFRSTSQSHDELKNIDGGDLIITNQRIFFAGKQRISNALFKKIVSIEPYSDGIVLHKDGRERAQYFLWPENFIKYNGAAVTGYAIQDIIEKQLMSSSVAGNKHFSPK